MHAKCSLKSFESRKLRERRAPHLASHKSENKGGPHRGYSMPSEPECRLRDARRCIRADMECRRAQRPRYADGDLKICSLSLSFSPFMLCTSPHLDLSNWTKILCRHERRSRRSGEEKLAREIFILDANHN